jgi:5-formyltetrahydrofolate cyclo-ligase
MSEDNAVRQADAKSALRDQAKAARKRAFDQYGAAAGAALRQHGLDFLTLPDRPVVSGFFAIRDEINPLPLMLKLYLAGSRLALPAMLGKGRPLLMRAWAPGEPLAQTTWGIQEPLGDAAVVEPDVVLVPLLAFDLRGYRLGYGGGFYDRTLSALRAKKTIVAVGVAYDEQKVDAVPHEGYDQRLDWVLTPSGATACHS